MKINPKLKNSIFQISALLILLAAIIYYFDPAIAKYVMVVGVIGFAATTVITPYPGKSLRGKRLFNIQIFAVLLMIASTVLLFMNINGWVVTLLIAALLTLYAAIAMSMAHKKEQEDNKK
ncbi:MULTISPECIES: hypothetical protein [Dysgonomonas]|jgi:phosphatidylserine synthase|uniref:Uncharacterized protein n=1 Tax=Dysgonomonas gadei ATCC BAA-286 TaxID=742766 RepID=F5IWI9_9BACT|nr:MULTISPECIES: hypothetical protein [Dysgonomonas]EGK02499.1 hypothetical protein HMPREF9455_01456 [Dysgonomonas gadei ATCC BAA-286]MBF0650394.1 hypothetical protein [Dysgonomonas sp. GY75]